MSLQEAIQHFQSGRLDDAERLCAAVLEAEPNNRQALMLMAGVSSRRGDDAGALPWLERAEAGPPAPAILIEAGRVLRRLDRGGEAVAKLEQAAALDASPAIRFELAAALLESGDTARARGILEEILAQAPGNPNVLKLLSQVAHTDKNYAAFFDYSERALRIDPSDLQVKVAVVMTALQTGDPERALALCNEMLAAHPSMTGAYGYKYIALAESGRLDEARELIDIDHFVRKIPARCPAGYASVDEFNEALTAHFHDNTPKLATLKGYTTRSGWQSPPGRLFENDPQLGAAVDGMIQAAVDEYVAGLPSDQTHPVHLTRPVRPHLESWCVVLQTGGHQAPHMHPNGWLSGVYYVKLPDDFDEQASPNAGHITFGRGQEGLHTCGGPGAVTFRPEVSHFFLFPSWYWHNTEPLESSAERICMAFDLNRGPQPAR